MHYSSVNDILIGVSKTKWRMRFARRERITDESLCEAINRAERGIVDADLGGGLIKQRVARVGQGRSGGYRMLVAYRARGRAVFLLSMAKQDLSRLAKAILETVDGMHGAGIMNGDGLAKITLRHVGKPTGAAAPITGEEIRKLREQAHLSQAVFARCLNVTTGYVSQLERGAKRPTGAALALLNVVRRKGIEVVL